MGRAVFCVALMFCVLSAQADDLTVGDLVAETARGAEIYAEKCARCHGGTIEMVLAPEDASQIAAFLASHKTRFDQDRTDRDNADLAAYLVSLSPTQRN